MNSAQQRKSEQSYEQNSSFKATDVPANWFQDPTNPQVSTVKSNASSQKLEAEATAFLSTHEKISEKKQETDKAKLLKVIYNDLDDTSELSWQVDALCVQTDPEAFFPEKGGSTRDAKKVCGACSVKNQCLEYALSSDERFGIWGGLSERERRKLRKRSM
ncbi:MAG: WhiB family transcriptional regulator [Micrococcaceae bacterium]